MIPFGDGKRPPKRQLPEIKREPDCGKPQPPANLPAQPPKGCECEPLDYDKLVEKILADPRFKREISGEEVQAIGAFIINYIRNNPKVLPPITVELYGPDGKLKKSSDVYLGEKMKFRYQIRHRKKESSFDSAP